ncbi:MAG: Clp protease N-terminal domain-containing protein, partial [Acidobacteriota bacterium]
MRFEKLTIKAQEALQAAQRRAESLDSAQLEPEHLLDALLTQEDGLVAPLLKKLGVSNGAMLADLDKHLSSQPKVHGAQISLSPGLD